MCIRDSGYNVKSSGFNVFGVADTLYMSDKPNANRRTGKLFLFKLQSKSGPVVVSNNVGTIDYEKGEIMLDAVNITGTSKKVQDVSIIEVSACPESNDVIGLQDLYLQLDNSNSLVTMVSDTISSGADISGSNYVVSSSFPNGRDDRESPLVRGVPQYSTITGTEAYTVQEVDTSYATTYTTSTTFNSTEVTANSINGGY